MRERGIQRKVLAAIQDCGVYPVTVENLAAKTRLTIRQVTGATTELVQKELIRRCGAGIFRTVTPTSTPTPTPVRVQAPVLQAPSRRTAPAVEVVGSLADGTGVVIRNADGGLRIARFE